MSHILLVDDDATHIDELHAALQDAFHGERVQIDVWVPKGDEKADERFAGLVTPATALVVTDYDLTGNGKTGLFGSTIVDWCKRRFIPVGDYSRGGYRNMLPKEPDQYEIRIPADPSAAAAYIHSIFNGFVYLHNAIHGNWAELSAKRSPAAILAAVLGRPIEESRFALYGTKLGSANASLMSEISPVTREEAVTDIKLFLPYVLGHLLLNVILRFPGPILDRRVLAAFLGIHAEAIAEVQAMFEDARYEGPFHTLETFYWLSGVETILEQIRNDSLEDEEAETIGQLNRITLEKCLSVELRRHDCPRCAGEQGGLYCPFTRRTICQRATCSVSTNAWIPEGAQLCRIEKVFYDEWAPLLGF